MLEFRLGNKQGGGVGVGVGGGFEGASVSERGMSPGCSMGFNIEKILFVKRTPRRGDRLRRLDPLRIPRNIGRGFRGLMS